MTNAAQTPITQNEDWGFWGTMNNRAEAAWPIAMTTISDATNQPLDSVRAFLDFLARRYMQMGPYKCLSPI